MAYNTEIGNRIEKVVAGWKNRESKKMFGGICHLIKGNMFSGVHKDFLILRLGESKADEALEMAHVRPFDVTGRPMKGWVMVSEEGFKDDEELETWLKKARAFVGTLPPK